MMDLDNRLTDDETLEAAYDIFLELAQNNLDPADILLFNLQFKQRRAAELFSSSEAWHEQVDFDLNPDLFADVVIELAEHDAMAVNDVFTRILICRDRTEKVCHILWKECVESRPHGRHSPGLRHPLRKASSALAVT